MKGLNSINTNTLTNNFCQKMSKTKDLICNMCYSVSQLQTFRKNCTPSFQRNSDLLSREIIDPYYLPQITDKIFRFSSHGELINDYHFINLINICKKSYKTTFSLWTKQKQIVNRVLKSYDKPKNLILIYSSPKVNTRYKLPENFDKVFTNYTEENTTLNCFGDCLNCRKCYTLTDKTQYINEKIKKYSKKLN